MIEFFSKTRKQLKIYFDSIRNERLKNNLLQAIPFWIASLIAGLVAVFYTRLFAYTERGTAYIFQHFSWMFFFLTPLCFIISWWLVKKFSSYARGSGIPQIMASIELATPKEQHKINKLLSLRIIFIKILSSLVLVFGGGVIGREGPTIQISGAIFRKINQLLPKWWPNISRRNMIMTGAAAGLAAAFNTPLGGIVFAVEELTKTHISYFKTALFTAVIIAGLTAQGLLGPYLYLGFPNIKDLSSFVFVGVIAVSILAGLSGSIMSKLILIIFRWKSKFKFNYQHVSYLVVCALLLATLAFFINVRIFGSGKEIMTTTLFTSNKSLPWYMPLFRIIGPIFSFTTGGAGGVFAPSLSAGASIGAVFAGWFHLSDSNANLLILSGMVAFLTGVTRTPFTSAILVLEMTDRHNVIFHLMLAGMVASLVALAVDKHSFYDHLKYFYLHELNKEEIEENKTPDEPAPNVAKDQ
ncbi:MAG TPA: chloride channel protein [Puia sp.]|nr:chloride channel protein [Puia sp.]